MSGAKELSENQIMDIRTICSNFYSCLRKSIAPQVVQHKMEEQFENTMFLSQYSLEQSTDFVTNLTLLAQICQAVLYGSQDIQPAEIEAIRKKFKESFSRLGLEFDFKDPLSD